MMKCFALVVLFVAVACANRQKRWLVDTCSGDGQCGDKKCCVLNKFCAPAIQLPKYAPCTDLTDCLQCSEGSSCTTYSEIEMMGNKFQLKSCLPPDAVPSTIATLDGESELRERRGIFDNLPLPQTCSTENECGENKCCLFNKICSPRLFKYSPCNLTDLHKCGCAAGTSCQGKEYEIFGKKFTLNFCFPDA